MDALRSTGSSHQRTFVVDVMGWHCGYLALMTSIAPAANWVMIPEQPSPHQWAQQLCRDIQAGRVIGRRQSLVIVAEGARDRAGNASPRKQSGRFWKPSSVRTLNTYSGPALNSGVVTKLICGTARPPFDSRPPEIV